MLNQIIPWVLSATTVYTMFLAGNMTKKTWIVGLFSQGLWLFWIISTETWGLIPGNIALWVVYYRNHLKWSKCVENSLFGETAE